MKRPNEFLSALKANQLFIMLYSLLFIFYVIVLPKEGHWGDAYCWLDWSKFYFEHGFSKIYKTWTDYPPLYNYVLWIYANIQGSAQKIEDNIYLLKIFTIAIEFIGGFFIVKFISFKIKNPSERFLLSLFYFINVAIFYNSIIWGQVDGILATLVFISIYYAIRNKINQSIIFFILAINFKIQAIIFLPVIGLMTLSAHGSNFKIKTLIKWIGIALAIQVLIILPFLISGQLPRVLDVIIKSFGKYPFASLNAYNFWHWVLNGDLAQIPDSTEFMSISYKKWGLFMFFATSFFALLPLLKASYNSIIKKTTEIITQEKILIICAIIPLLFFFFNTQMHERYSHPALIFLVTYSILSKNYFPTLMVCVAYFLNLEDVYRFLKLNNYGVFMFKKQFIAALYFVGILLLYIKLYNIRLNFKPLFKSKH